MLKLPSDVLVLPLSQVGDDDTGVKATCVGSHPQLLNSLFFEVQETYIIILLRGKNVYFSIKTIYFLTKIGEILPNLISSSSNNALSRR